MAMGFIDTQYKLACLYCQADYAHDQVDYYCPKCEFEGALDIVYDYQNISARFKQELLKNNTFDMWRYRSLLPTKQKHEPLLHTGGTPLYRLKSADTGRVYIKDDSRNPSGSLKDRASAIAIALAQSQSVKTIAVASTGNAAAALACMSAGQGIRCVIFAPASAAREKLAQVRAYGGEVIEVNGGYDEAFAACNEACMKNNWYNRSTGINSYMTEGKKTVAFEIWEQLNWTVPDRIFVPVGNGGIVGAVYKGFHELKLMGLISQMPKIVGVQSIGSNYMYRAWKADDGPHKGKVIPAQTAASSISVGLPRDRIKALRAIKASGGEFITVNDSEIFKALVKLAQTSGVFAEPGAAAAYAGALKWDVFNHAGTSVVLITGSGLKDVSGLINSGILDAASL
jgi:threonine synthase